MEHDVCQLAKLRSAKKTKNLWLFTINVVAHAQMYSRGNHNIPQNHEKASHIPFYSPLLL